MHKLIPYERETIIQMDDGSKVARVYTYQKRIKKILEDLLISHPDEVRIIRRFVDGLGLEVEVPRNWIRIRPPKKMNLSEDERIKRSNRMKEINAKKARQKE